MPFALTAGSGPQLHGDEGRVATREGAGVSWRAGMPPQAMLCVSGWCGVVCVCGGGRHEEEEDLLAQPRVLECAANIVRGWRHRHVDAGDGGAKRRC